MTSLGRGLHFWIVSNVWRVWSIRLCAVIIAVIGAAPEFKLQPCPGVRAEFLQERALP